MAMTEQRSRRGHVQFRAERLSDTFPGFAALVFLGRRLFGSDLIVLVTTFFLLAVAPLAIATVGFVWQWNLIWLIRAWSSTALGLIAAWSTLGSGRWHFRFPLALLAGSWILANLWGAFELFLVPRYDPSTPVAVGVGAFAFTAFGAAWVRSIGCVEYRRSHSVLSHAPVRRGQFTLANVMALSLLTAMIAALTQTPRALWQAFDEVILKLDQPANWAQSLAAAVCVLGVLLAVRSRPVLAVVLIFALLIGLAEDPWWRSWVRRGNWTMEAQVIRDVLQAGPWYVAIASLVLGGLRLSGFRLEKSSSDNRSVNYG